MNGMDLNGQTAPESTHGLFGAPQELKIDKRRSATELSNTSSSLDIVSQPPRSQSVYGALPTPLSVGINSTSNSNISSSNNSNSNTNRLSQHHRSALHTVNEEDSSRPVSSSSAYHPIEPSNRSSVANFNESPMGQQQQQNRRSTCLPGVTLQDYRRYSSGASNYQDDDDNKHRRMSREDALAEAEAKLNGYKYLSPTPHQQSTSTSRHTSLRPSHVFNNNNKPVPVEDMSSQKQNRRLSEPNARAYQRHSDNYSSYHQQPPPPPPSSTSSSSSHNHHQQDYQKRRSFNAATTSSGQVYSKRTSLQLSSSSSGMDGLMDSSRRTNSKPTHLFVDVNKSDNRRSRNFNNDWRASNTTAAATATTAATATNGTSSNRSSMCGFVPFTPTRITFSREDNTVQQQVQQRRALFTAHLPFSAVTPHLKSHQLVSGMLRVNKRNRSDAYVFCEPYNADIYICGSRDRNRALEGDHVAIRLVDVDMVMREKMEKEEAKFARNNNVPVVRKPDEEDEKEIIFGGEEDVDLVKPKYCGVVTAILERAQNQTFSGTLGLMRPSNKRHQKRDNEDDRDTSPRIVWFKPTDKRVPLIAIPVEQAPAGFLDNNKAFENILFLGSIKRWPITSLHPFGVLERELGSVEQLGVQFKAILADNNYLNGTFSQDVIQCLPLLPWSPPKESLSVRRDLRSCRCITLDNTNSGDHDVALSFEPLGSEAYQVGLHVADFTAFIKPQSAIDKEAKDRASGIYLHQSVPLWPEDLLEHCTDLAPEKDRFAFSVIWKFNANNQLIDTCFVKTIIRSQAIMTPNEIQGILDTNDDDAGVQADTDSDTKKEHLWARDLKALFNLSQHLKDKRRMDGALFLAETQLEVEMADDTPMGIAAKIDPPAMDILTEFKILANTGVAQKVSRGFPDIALLQSQSPPNERKLHDLTNYLRGLGYSIDPSSAQTLQASVDAIENPDAKAVITTLVLKTLRPVKYFCTGSFDISRWHHYGMNLPLYTEFTSPSRKYACLIVHRQLEAVLAKEKRFYLDPEYVQKIAQHCNAKEQSIINAREQAQHLLLSKFLTTSRQTSTTHEAIVVGVQELAFDVIVPSLGLERRIHVMNLPLRTSHYSQNEGVLNLFWLPGVPTSDAMVEQADFDDRDDDDYSMMGDDYNNNYRHHLDGGNNRVNDQTLHRLSVSENVLVENPTSGPPPTSPTKRRPRSMSLRAVDGESIASQQHCTIPQECCLVVRPFDFIRVVITTDSIRNPPLIRVLASNPFVHHEN